MVGLADHADHAAHGARRCPTVPATHPTPQLAVGGIMDRATCIIPLGNKGKKGTPP
jgi:hypothetical protein